MAKCGHIFLFLVLLIFNILQLLFINSPRFVNFINNTVLSDGSYLGNGTILILWGKASIDTMNLQFIGNKSYNSILRRLSGRLKYFNGV